MNKAVLIFLITSSGILLCNKYVKGEALPSSQLHPTSHGALSKILGLDLGLRSIRAGIIDGIDEAVSYEADQWNEILALYNDDNKISFGGLIWILLKNIFLAVFNFVIGNYIAIIWNVFYIVEGTLKFLIGSFA